MEHNERFAQRISFVIASACLAFIGISIRLFQLQIKNRHILFARSEHNFIRTQKIVSPRGIILDYQGRPLATNRPVFTLYWHGTQQKKLTQDQQELINTIETLFFKKNSPSIVDIDANTQKLTEAIERAEKSGQRIVIGQDISFDTISALIERYPNHQNLVFASQFKRDYPYNTLACHILGYLGSITESQAGQMGLEKIYEKDLRGNPGKLKQTVNSRGALIAEEALEYAQRGADLITTIDLDLQKIAEEVFPSERSGCLIIMNPRNGALRVLISRPAFDPAMFTQPVGRKEWQDLQAESRPFLNRVFSALYPPASLFKLVTVTAALETKLVDQESTWFCPGYTTFAGRKYFCHHHQGHGTVNTAQAVAFSCNIPFYDIGRRIKIDTLAEYAHRFGLGLSTNSVFPEKPGLIPTAHWKRETKGEPWWPGETLSACIGQSYLLVTPIQMVRMVAAICEGFLVRPCIIEQEASEQEHERKQKLDIQASTRLFLKQSMARVVKRGTGQGLRTLSGMTIHAKTGTAQTRSLTYEEREGILKKPIKTSDHAWFVAHVQYKEYEPLVMLVLLEHAGFSTVAISVAKQFLKKYCHIVDQN